MWYSALFVFGWIAYFLHANREWFVGRLYHAKVRLGDYDAGLRRLHRVRFAIPRIKALAMEASILLLAGRAAEAEPLIHEALAILTPGSSVPRERLCSLLGHIYTVLERYDEAEQWLEEATRIGDVTGNSQNGLAELRLQQGRAQEALAIASLAIEVAARRASRKVPVVYYADLAWAQALAGRMDDARESIAAALAERKDTAAGQATVAWRVGMALLAMQSAEEAYGHFRIGADADPHGKSGALCREELRKAGVDARSALPVAAAQKRRRWALPPGIKPATAFVAVLVIGAIACPLLMRVNPGRLPDFRDSGKIYRFAGGHWLAVPVLPGGVENAAVSPNGSLWATTPAEDELVRWDGARWIHSGKDAFGGFALQGNDVWVLGVEGVARFDGQSWRTYPEATRTGPAAVIASGPSGVWVLDDNGHLSHFDGNTWTVEDLRSAAELRWDRRADYEPQLRVADDGALWLLAGGLWRRGSSGWRETPIRFVDWHRATLAGQDGDKVWLSTPAYLFEVRPDGQFGTLFDLAKLPGARDRSESWTVATEGNKTWLSTAQGLLVFEGGRWRDNGIPPGVSLVKEVAIGADGTKWVVTETRPWWRIALWLARPLSAVALALLAMGGLLALMAKSGVDSRLAADRAMLGAAGVIPGMSIAERQAEYKRQSRALWWKVPGFLIAFPFFGVAISAAHTYLHGRWPDLPEWAAWTALLAPFALLGAFLFLRPSRKRSGAASQIGGLAWFIILVAVGDYFFDQFRVTTSPILRWAALFVIAAGLWFLFQMRSNLAQRIWRRSLATGQYDRARRRLKILSLGNPTPTMLTLEGALFGTAGRKAEAEKCYRNALARSASPEFRRRTLCLLGYTLTDLGRYEEAQKCLEGVIEMGDRTGGARLGMSDLLLQQGKEPERALGLTEEAIRLRAGRDKALAEPMGNKAWALALMGRLQEMDDSVAKALHSIDSAESQLVASVHWRVGKALAAVERVSQAIEHFRAAWQADPHGYHGQIARMELQHYGAAGV